MIEQLTIPFHYEYMLKAIFVSALIGGVCAFLSCFVTLKGWSLMGDALSHSVVPGVALALMLGLPFAVGAFFAGLLAAAAMGFVKAKTPIREDATIGIVFTSFFALGLLLISLYPTGFNLRTIVFGNMLGIADFDILQAIAICGIAMAVLLAKWKDLLLFCFDANQARSIGLNTTALHFILLSLLSAVAVAALQAVGACLVVAMLVTPGATAYLLTDRFGRMLGIASTMGVLTAAAGAYASYFLDGSVGGCIVVLQTTLFLLAFAFAPKHGMLAARRAGRKAVTTTLREVSA
ncbi:manganese/iron transport system permease protein [Terrimicrobium sacchariphilum]|uniref:Manganese/iron transport system permease protein n=1 Tax=Terrimicrobium sacchariphilum TaxID=690879 RepID=A0A146G9L0_TERSA|nr:metal ABC transporter permease [Terrimicrobium sacchariphilum]GAT33517.1 manganese/iron transport system permease protein [Terrimicrobium sacchariphilum]